MDPDSRTACDICYHLNSRDEHGKLQKKWTVELDAKLIQSFCLEFQSSHLRGAAKSGCPCCSMIIRGLRICSLKMKIFDDSRPYSGRFVIRKGCSLGVEIEVYHSRQLHLVRKLLLWGLKRFEIQSKGGKMDGPISLEFYSKPAQGDRYGGSTRVLAPGSARNVPVYNSIQRSTRIIREWIAECDNNHKVCSSKFNNQDFPTRVLDVRQLGRKSSAVVLVETANVTFSSHPVVGFKQQYATLSHCWGKAQLLRTTNETIEKHKDSIDWKSLPLTFRDAISIVRALGIRYIWIDSLCIIQDDQDDWKREATRMATVYSNSYLNLAATGSSDSRGGCLYRRKLHQENSTLSIKSYNVDAKYFRGKSDYSTVFVRPSLESVHHRYNSPNTPRLGHDKVLNIGTPLLTRAWVFQERQLAPRTIHFHPSELVMECKFGLRCECTGLEKLYTSSIKTEFDLKRLQASKILSRWLELISEFCKLSLTQPSDRLVALIGVANTFQDRLKCGYLAGIWESDISRGLLWTLRGTSQPSNYTKIEQKTPQKAPIFAPSWSWASAISQDGGIIAFPASQDSTFRTHPYFSYIGTNFSTIASESLELSEMDFSIIHIRGLAVMGELEYDYDEVIRGGGDERIVLKFGSYAAGISSPGTMMSFDVHSDNDTDHAINKSTTILCILVGTMVLRDPGTELKTVPWLCTLLCKLSSRRPENYERVGVFNVREDTGIFQDAEKKTIELI